MYVHPLAISEVVQIEPVRHVDERGFFSEVMHAERLRRHGIEAMFVQENHSFSRDRGVVRGLHYQTGNAAQAKLVRVVRGAIFDVALDVRTGSPTWGRHVSAVLSADNWRQLWIPVGFAHGFCTLEPGTEVVYLVTQHYAPQAEAGVRWDDPALGIDWPVKPDQAILSPKDLALPALRDMPSSFTVR